MAQLETKLSTTGVIAIGRNEGDRLRKCLRSVTGRAALVIYVDSGSTDSSISMARDAGCDVVELDMSFPFTAARARNEGFDRMRQLSPGIQYVQFVDGDCEVAAGWMEKAASFLDTHPDVAVVCGRRRERYRERSVYNKLCDIEWDTPIGETKACGGDALMRATAFETVGRYRTDLIAGEEPELCVRLRAAGWRVWRLDDEMTLHDANITQFRQWWRRTLRAGYADAQGAYLHGRPPERHRVWEARRARLWSVWIPAGCLAATIALRPWGAVAWLIYPLQFVRQTIRNRGPLRDRALLALFQVLARFPEACGQVQFLRGRLLGRQTRLIEYK